ncbi:MAG: NAD-dependent epimerase/dehydratase family protein [Caldilineaceae bacterium]
MSNHLHVIFGTGPVGMAIMDELVRQELPVRMVNRSGKTDEPLPAGVELINGDVAEQAFAIKAAEGAAVLYNALNPTYSKWPELFPPLQAGAVAAAAANNAKLVVMDNLYMYGDPHGQPLTEAMPHNAHTKKGKLRAEMARDLMAAHEAGRVQVVVGRASDFIGPRVDASAMGGDLVIKRAIQGKAAQVVGDVDTPHSYSYMPDIGRALVTLAQHDDAFGQVWHLPTPPAVSTRRLLELIYAEAGQPLKMQVAPKWLLRLLGIFNPDAGEMVEMVYEFEQPFLIDDRKFVNRFGWGATALETVVQETVEWFK